MLEIAAQSNPCSFSIDFQPTPHVLRWKGGRIYLLLGEWRPIFFAQQVFTSLVPKPSIKTDFVHWHCSLPFRIFANSQQTRFQPNWSFALLSSHCKYKARPRRACACLPSMQQASGAFKRERGRAVKDLVKHATIVSLSTFCNRTTAPDWSWAPRLGESDLPLSDQQRKLSVLRFSVKIALQQVLLSRSYTPSRSEIDRNTSHPHSEEYTELRERLHPPFRPLTAGTCRSLIKLQRIVESPGKYRSSAEESIKPLAKTSSCFSSNIRICPCLVGAG